MSKKSTKSMKMEKGKVLIGSGWLNIGESRRNQNSEHGGSFGRDCNISNKANKI